MMDSGLKSRSKTKKPGISAGLFRVRYHQRSGTGRERHHITAFCGLGLLVFESKTTGAEQVGETTAAGCKLIEAAAFDQMALVHEQNLIR